MRAPVVVGVAVLCAAVVLVSEARRAEACGCLSPPEPVGDEEFAVSQQAEQIIFEYEDGVVTAHVLIQYAGAPESFAWIVPVPAVPELELSALGAFGLLEKLTAPAVGADIENICPQPEWACRYHEAIYCGDVFGGGDDSADFVDSGASSSDADDPGGGGTPGVDIIDRQTVGDYDTVIFDAGDTAAAVRWLQQEGFIVNETMAPYMQPYADMDMLFVAAKLLPGADATAIKPLMMRFPAAAPMVPLVLTAVAAEPHLTVTTYIHGDVFFTPAGHPVVDIDPDRLAFDNADRFNYPMVLARAIDEAGGDGFVIEYRGSPIVPDFDQGSGCCGEFDFCGLGDNQQCECPTSSFEVNDCAKETDLLEGIALLEALASRHTRLTRITTRLSPEEMTFDPMYVPDPDADFTGPLLERGIQLSLEACETQIYDNAMYQDAVGTQSCAAVYCGPGTCASTWAGAGCACNAGTVARVFTDLDGQPSVTCVPDTPPVDLEGGGIDLPDACATIDCGLGVCVDLNGVPHCQCDGGAAAVTDVLRKLPVCRAIDELSGSPGAEDYSEMLRELSVCAPPPPTCAPGGWLERVTVANPGASCGGAEPLPEQLIPPPAPSCPGWGCGCRGGGDDAGVLLVFAIGWLAFGRPSTRARPERSRRAQDERSQSTP